LHWALKLIFTLLLMAAALVILYQINNPFGPYPFLFIETGRYLVLLLVFLLGTALPLIWLTFSHIEDFPLAPGGMLSKVLNTAFIFFAGWAISNCIVRGIQYLLLNSPISNYGPVFSVLELSYFFYLLNSAATKIFNIKMKKALLSAVPFILSFILFPLEITLVRSWFAQSRENPFERATPTGYLLLVFFALVPLSLVIISNLSRRSGRSLATSEKFSKPLIETDQPEQMYQQSLTLLNMGKRKQALKLLDDVISKSNYKPDVLFQRGKLLLEMKNPEGAARDFETYLDVKKRNISDEPYIFLIESYRTLGEWENVIEVSNEFLGKFPTHMQGWFFKAEAFKKYGDDKAAVSTLKEMLGCWKDVPVYRHSAEKEWLDKGKNLLHELTTPKK
jgi:tetratricopeptide (TPR) repeat protein